MNNMKTLILTTLIILGMIALYLTQRPRLERFNESQCMVYGYESDCVTKLKGGEHK